MFRINLAPPSRRDSLLCPQKQCLSGKVDRLLGRTNQRLPPGGSSRRSRVRESALRYNQYKSKVARAPSVTLRSEPPKLISFASGNPCRVPPSSRRKAILVPDSTPKKCNTPYHAARRVKKDRDEKSLSFCNIGAFIERPRATNGRPYTFKIHLQSHRFKGVLNRFEPPHLKCLQSCGIIDKERWKQIWITI